MLSKNFIKYFSSLRQKKFRKQYKRFLAEGEKIVREIIRNPGHLKPVSLIADIDFLKTVNLHLPEVTIYEASQKDLERITSLETANHAVMEIEIPDYFYSSHEIPAGPALFYEDIRDPGNLGTILRTADWFGILNVYCSMESVDPFNPKVIQSSMGSISRVKVYQVNTSEFINDPGFQSKNLKKIATVLDGANIYEFNLPDSSIIFFGNESRGLSDRITDSADEKISIPSWNKSGAESLNVGISTAIVCSELRRQRFGE